MKYASTIIIATMVSAMVAACANTADTADTAAEDTPTMVDGSEEQQAMLERDARRTAFIEGFECNQTLYGQPTYTRYLPGGIGLSGNQEEEGIFRWFVKNDKLCHSSEFFPDSCADLPSEDIENEEAWIIDGMEKSCLQG